MKCCELYIIIAESEDLSSLKKMRMTISKENYFGEPL